MSAKLLQYLQEAQEYANPVAELGDSWRRFYAKLKDWQGTIGVHHDTYRTRRLVEAAYGEAVAVGARPRMAGRQWAGLFLGRLRAFQVVSPFLIC